MTMTDTEARWTEIRRRLKTLSLNSAKEVRTKKARHADILRARARALAAVPAVEDDKSVLDLVTFAIDGDRFAIEAEYVREVLRRADITPLPGTESPYAGVTAHRGDIFPVLDLSRFICGRPAGMADTCALVVCGRRRAELGLLATAVDRITRLSESVIHAGPGLAQNLRGMTADAMMILDGGIILSHPKLSGNGMEEAL